MSDSLKKGDTASFLAGFILDTGSVVDLFGDNASRVRVVGQVVERVPDKDAWMVEFKLAEGDFAEATASCFLGKEKKAAVNSVIFNDGSLWAPASKGSTFVNIKLAANVDKAGYLTAGNNILAIVSESKESVKQRVKKIADVPCKLYQAAALAQVGTTYFKEDLAKLPRKPSKKVIANKVAKILISKKKSWITIMEAELGEKESTEGSKAKSGKGKANDKREKDEEVASPEEHPSDNEEDTPTLLTDTEPDSEEEEKIPEGNAKGKGKDKELHISVYSTSKRRKVSDGAKNEEKPKPDSKKEGKAELNSDSEPDAEWDAEDELSRILRDSANDEGINADPILRRLGISGVKSKQRRRFLLSVFKSEPRASSLESDTLEKIWKGEEVVYLTELQPAKRSLRLGQQAEDKVRKPTRDFFEGEVRFLIEMYSCVAKLKSYVQDMNEHFAYVRKLGDRMELNSVIETDHCIREQCQLGRWHKGSKPLMISQQALRLKLETEAPASSSSYLNRTQATYTNAKGAGNASQSTVGKNCKTCKNWAANKACTFGKRCRFGHYCPACPGKEEHREDSCPKKGDSAWRAVPKA